MTKFEARILIRRNKEKPLSYAHMIQERLSSSEGRRQRFMSEYPWQKSDEDDCHTTLLSQELQKLSQRKVLSVITNVDQSDHNHYILREAVYSIIQEAKLSKEKSSSSEGRSQRFISEYTLSKYLSLKNDDDVDPHHTTLLSQELTQRKVVLFLIINVEDQSANHNILEETLYYENTGTERPTAAIHLLLLRAANYPKVVVATEVEAVIAELADEIELDELEIGLIKSLEEGMVVEVKVTDIEEAAAAAVAAEAAVEVFDDDQITGDEPMDDDTIEEVREEGYQEEEVGEEGQEEEEENEDEDEDEEDEDEDEDEDEEDDDEDEDEDEDEEEISLGLEGQEIEETVLENLVDMVEEVAEEVVAEIADEMELEELEVSDDIRESIEEYMVAEVKETILGRLTDLTAEVMDAQAEREAEEEAARQAAIAKAAAEDADIEAAYAEAVETGPALDDMVEAFAALDAAEANEKAKTTAAKAKAAASKAATEAAEAAAEAAEAKLAEAQAVVTAAKITLKAAEAVLLGKK